MTCAALLFFAIPAAAQIKQDSPVFVVNLLKPSSPQVAVLKAASFDAALATPPPPPLPGQPPQAPGSPLTQIIDFCSDPPPVEPGRTTILDRLVACAECLRAYQEKRYITNRGDETLAIIVFNAGTSRGIIRPVFQETPRESELVATAKALRKALDATKKETLGASCAVFRYTLQRSRSFLKVTVPITEEMYELEQHAELQGQTPAAPPAAANNLDPGNTANTKAEPATKIDTPEVTVGPRERWIVSADFTFSKASVKLGADPTPSQEAVKSKDLFVALNFAVSDLLVDRESPLQRRSIFHELLLKVQLTPSKEPWTSWAVGVGVRGYRIRTLLWNMDVAHPFVSFGRQEVDGDKPKWRAVFGLGFDPRSMK